jgi:hypothetical protein
MAGQHSPQATRYRTIRYTGGVASFNCVFTVPLRDSEFLLVILLVVSLIIYSLFLLPGESARATPVPGGNGARVSPPFTSVKSARS